MMRARQCGGPSFTEQDKSSIYESRVRILGMGHLANMVVISAFVAAVLARQAIFMSQGDRSFDSLSDISHARCPDYRVNGRHGASARTATTPLP